MLSYIKFHLGCFLLILFLPSLTFAQTCNNQIIATTNHFLDNNNGTISDPITGLIWKKCSEGQYYNSTANSCDGTLFRYSWQDAFQQAQNVNTGNSGETTGYTNWRLPNIKELESLLEISCFNPAINNNLFPNTPIYLHYWSSTQFHQENLKWSHSINFGSGSESTENRGSTLYLRLVRN